MVRTLIHLCVNYIVSLNHQKIGEGEGLTLIVVLILIFWLFQTHLLDSTVSVSVCVCVCVCVCVRLFATTWTRACQTPLSMGFSRQEYCGLPCPSAEALPSPGIKPVSRKPPALAGSFFTTSATLEALSVSVLQLLVCSSYFTTRL